MGKGTHLELLYAYHRSQGRLHRRVEGKSNAELLRKGKWELMAGLDCLPQINFIYLFKIFFHPAFPLPGHIYIHIISPNGKKQYIQLVFDIWSSSGWPSECPRERVCVCVQLYPQITAKKNIHPWLSWTTKVQGFSSLRVDNLSLCIQLEEKCQHKTRAILSSRFSIAEILPAS